jgi:methyl-accepting chemotaxis protein
MDTLINLLNNPSVISLVIGFLIMGFAKSIIKIFNMGVMFKTNLATKKEQKDFEERIRQDLVNYKEEIQRTVLSICLRTIERVLRNVDAINNTANELKVSSESIKSQMEDLDAKYDEFKEVATKVRTLSDKVQRLEFGRDTTIGRRSEK